MTERTGHECTDPKLGDLLAAYELGLLAGPDQARFETHLNDCPACQEELYQGAPTAESLRADPGRYADLMAGALKAGEPSPCSEL